MRSFGFDSIFHDPAMEHDGDDCECLDCQPDDDYRPDEYLPEDIDDAQVRWSIGADGVGRVEVVW